MKYKPPIGLWKFWPDTQRGNLGNVKHVRFGQRAYIRRCKSDRECREFIQSLIAQGYKSI